MSHIQRIGHFEVSRRDRLGRGGHASVFKAKDTRDGSIVAAKEVFIDMHDRDDIKQVQREVDLHGGLPPHVNIVKFLGSHIDAELWIFTEFCEHGDLEVYFAKNVMSPELRLDIMTQVTEGLKHLHSLNPPVAHRDVKPRNVLLKEVNGKLIAKLCDLGIAKAVQIDDRMTVGFQPDCGSWPYMSPELFQLKDSGKGTYSIKVDLFSSGIF